MQPCVMMAMTPLVFFVIPAGTCLPRIPGMCEVVME